MARHKYMRSPPNLTGMPPGVPYIIGNEAAERFSYYGMKSVLTVFMAHYILNQSGVLAPMQENEAYMYTHYFVFGVYFLPILGAILGRRLARQILDDSVAFYRLLPGQPHARVHGHVMGNRDWSTHNASDRIVPDLFGRRRHQTMRVGQCRRSIWRFEQTFALQNVWLVLFLDQRRLLHLFDSLSVAPCESEVGTRLGVWNSRHRDGDRHFVLLGRSQENGPRAACRPRLFERNIQQGRSHYAWLVSQWFTFLFWSSGRFGE